VNPVSSGPTASEQVKVNPGSPVGGARKSLASTIVMLSLTVIIIIGFVLGVTEKASVSWVFDRYLGDQSGFYLFIGLLLASIFGVIFTGRAGQILAGASVSFKEISRGGVIIFAAIAALVLCVAGLFLDSEGGAVGRVKMILTVTSGTASLIGLVMAIVLPALTFTREMETKSIYVGTTKPVPRWAFFSGKLLGVSLGLGIVLLLFGCGGFLAARLAVRSEVRLATEALENAHEVAAKQQKARAAGNSETTENREQVRDLIAFSQDPEKLQNPEHIPVIATRSWIDTRPALQELPEGEHHRFKVIKVGASQSFVVQVNPADILDSWLVIRVHARPAHPKVHSAPAILECGDIKRYIHIRRNSPVDVVLPANAVKGGQVQLKLLALADFEGNNHGLESAPRGTLSVARAGNSLAGILGKNLLLIWFQLLLLSTITMAAAAFVSFPVALVVGATTSICGMLCGTAAGILRMSMVAHGSDQIKSSGGLAELLRIEMAGLLTLMPDFDATNGGDYVAHGVYLPWDFILAAAVSLLLLRGIPAIFFGCYMFMRREVGA
jgi:hypothetical protein